MAYVGNGMVYLAKADGSEATNLTEDVSAGGLHWSPHGTELAFTRRDDSGETVLSVIEPTGQNPKVRDLVACGGGAPSWSADGGSLFAELSGRIIVVDVATGEAGQVKGVGASARFPMARPGSRMAE